MEAIREGTLRKYFLDGFTHNLLTVRRELERTKNSFIEMEVEKEYSMMDLSIGELNENIRTLNALIYDLEVMKGSGNGIYKA